MLSQWIAHKKYSFTSVWQPNPSVSGRNRRDERKSNQSFFYCKQLNKCPPLRNPFFKAHGLLTFRFNCQYSFLPEWIPMRIARLSVGMWRILKTLMDIKKCRAIVDISKACLLPLLMGTPLATMYASPMVSTLSKRIKMKAVSTGTIYEEQCTNKCNPPLSHTLVYWLKFGSMAFAICVSICGRERREGGHNVVLTPSVLIYGLFYSKQDHNLQGGHRVVLKMNVKVATDIGNCSWR